ncbi:hypothetical protein [Rickettsia endosymbiont of Orchestes rusci]
MTIPISTRVLPPRKALLHGSKKVPYVILTKSGNLEKTLFKSS